jgi:hypothetical protein
VAAQNRRPRVNLGIHSTIGGTWAVISTDGPPNLASLLPDDPQDLASWALEGWVVEDIHGNIDRGGMLRLRQGALVNQAQAVLGVIKDGKSFSAVARQVFGPLEEPDDWKDPDAWNKAGWRVVSITGNLEHGSFWVLASDLPDDAPAA